MIIDLNSHKAQLVLTAVAASAATAGVLAAYTSHTRRQKRRDLNDDVLRSLADQEAKAKAALVDGPSPGKVTPQAPPALTGDYSEELIREQLARNYAFFGEDGMAKVRKGRVVVVGCGGVGSWAAVMLVRS